jgi:predicted nuclease with TOPRIM domain
LSVFILVLSLLEASKEYSIKAERLFSCANEINDLMGNLKFIQATVVDRTKLEYDVKRINDEYHSLIKKVNENHDGIDYDIFRLSYKKKPKKTNDGSDVKFDGVFQIDIFEEFLIYIKLATQYSVYYFFIVAPPILLTIFVLLGNSSP